MKKTIKREQVGNFMLRLCENKGLGNSLFWTVEIRVASVIGYIGGYNVEDRQADKDSAFNFYDAQKQTILDGAK